MPLFRRKPTRENALVSFGTLALEKVYSSTLAITDALEIEDPNIKWRIQVESIGVFWHLISRFAYSLGGEDFRSLVQDSLADFMIRAVVKASFDTSRVDREFDVAAWEKRMEHELLNNINTCEMEYAQCQEVSGNREDLAWVTEEGTVVGLYGLNICRALGIDERDVAIRLHATKSLLESRPYDIAGALKDLIGVV